jgi:drug/metabolite transporter (DMT)-like permease
VLSRRAPLLGVALLIQPVGFVTALIVAGLRHEGLPGPESIALAALAGIAGVVGLINLYHGLAVGRMGVVAPITGLLAAVLPVAFGMFFAGLPALPVLLGIALALGAVVLVSRVPGEAGQRSGVEFGLAAGVGLGVLNILISQVPSGQLFASLAVVKVAAAVTVLLVIVARREAWRVGGSVAPALAGVGILDMGGNALFVLAAQAGRLDVAAVLSSLYPVVTVVLAATLLRERITRPHLLGIAVAIIAIGLIASGSAGG